MRPVRNSQFHFTSTSFPDKAFPFSQIANIYDIWNTRLCHEPREPASVLHRSTTQLETKPNPSCDAEQGAASIGDAGRFFPVTFGAPPGLTVLIVIRRRHAGVTHYLPLLSEQALSIPHARKEGEQTKRTSPCFRPNNRILRQQTTSTNRGYIWQTKNNDRTFSYRQPF